MGSSVKVAVAVAVCALAAALPARAQSSVDVVGLDGRRVAVTFGGMDRKTVITSDHGLKTTFEGVALRDILTKAGVPLGEALHGKALARIIIATATDGYQVAFAIAEVDAGFTDQVILVADRRNGQPLLPDTGPLQIVVPLDKRAGRWVRQVTKLEVRDVK